MTGRKVRANRLTNLEWIVKTHSNINNKAFKGKAQTAENSTQKKQFNSWTTPKRLKMHESRNS